MYHPTELAVYIHWPYCKSKCPYCDFYKELAKNIDQQTIIDEYISALTKYHELTSERIVKSIFFGGGTPSLIEPRNLARLIDHITTLWRTTRDIEISLEANPNTRHQTLFTDLKSSGINRLSLGVQALNENDLRFLGRTHNLAEARHCLNEVVRIFDNHSADLIYARPHQTTQQWQAELKEICSYGLKHISLYQLTIEEGTVFQRKNIHPLDEEAAAQLYDFSREYLQNYGYLQYEVSNFAQQGFQSCHNLTYWQGGDYLGIGKSAHGRLYLNHRHIATEYPFCHEPLTNTERAEELIIMGLRLNSGLDKAKFSHICGLNFYDVINQEKLAELKELNLITETSEKICATPNGFLLLNEIVRELCC